MRRSRRNVAMKREKERRAQKRKKVERTKRKKVEREKKRKRAHRKKKKKLFFLCILLRFSTRLIFQPLDSVNSLHKCILHARHDLSMNRSSSRGLELANWWDKTKLQLGNVDGADDDDDVDNLGR